jgi:hypothetical protein
MPKEESVANVKSQLESMAVALGLLCKRTCGALARPTQPSTKHPGHSARRSRSSFVNFSFNCT